jgi:hypothetical protein
MLLLLLRCFCFVACTVGAACNLAVTHVSFEPAHSPGCHARDTMAS